MYISKIKKCAALVFALSLTAISQVLAFEPLGSIEGIESVEMPVITEVFIDIGGRSGFIRYTACDDCKAQKLKLTKDTDIASSDGVLTTLKQLKLWVDKRALLISFKKNSGIAHDIYVPALIESGQ